MVQFGRKSDDKKNNNVEKKTSHMETHTLNKSNTDHVTYKTKDFIEDRSIIEFKERLLEIIINHIDLTVASKMPKAELRREIEGYLMKYTEEMKLRINFRELQNIIDDIINDMVGLGPLELLIADTNISDIMVNSPHRVYIETKGQLHLTDVRFRSEKHVLQIAQRIANQIGRRIDESSPMVDARLKDGSRVNIIIPPLSLEGTTISIRKFSSFAIHLDHMIKTNSLSDKMYKFLKMASQSRLNILISGGTGAGKTTILNALSEQIDPRERIVTIEDAAELRLQQPHVVRLESRPSNIEGKGNVNISDLVRNALRMRPDRIIIGECRGAEAFDMLQAMNTGHDGSMSTLHSNSAVEALDRLENMVLMSGHKLPSASIKNYIAGAVDLVIQVARMRDGIRRVTQITEISKYIDGKIVTKDIFSFLHVESSATHIEGEFVFHGLSDDISDRIRIGGASEDLLAFMEEVNEIKDDILNG